MIARDAGGILANDDPRAQTPPLEKLMALDWAQLKPVIADSLAHGAIEIGVVGDISEQAAIDAHLGLERAQGGHAGAQLSRQRDARVG